GESLTMVAPAGAPVGVAGSVDGDAITRGDALLAAAADVVDGGVPQIPRHEDLRVADGLVGPVGAGCMCHRRRSPGDAVEGVGHLAGRDADPLAQVVPPLEVDLVVLDRALLVDPFVVVDRKSVV